MWIKAGLIRQHQDASVEIHISTGQGALVVRGKPVRNHYARVDLAHSALASSDLAQLDYADGKICAIDETTFSRFAVNIAITIRRQTCPSLPDAGPTTSWFGVEDTFLCTGRGVVRHDPTFINNIARRSSPGNVHMSIGQQQPIAVQLTQVRKKIV